MQFFRNGWIFICASILAAQGFRATIVGRVTDDSGAVVVVGCVPSSTPVGVDVDRVEVDR